LGARLHANANGPVAHVGTARRLGRVVVDVDDLVQVLGHDVCHLAQLVKVKVPAPKQDSKMVRWVMP
jgi:hypothetical protein